MFNFDNFFILILFFFHHQSFSCSGSPWPPHTDPPLVGAAQFSLLIVVEFRAPNFFYTLY